MMYLGEHPPGRNKYNIQCYDVRRVIFYVSIVCPVT
jgi:hypothetical protein